MASGLLWLLAARYFLQAKPKVKKTIRGEVALPRQLSNKAFKQTFSGVVNAGLSMNFGFGKFNAGPFGSLTEFQIVKKFTGDPHSIQTTYTGGLKFSYDMLTSSGKGMFSPYIAPGYSFIKYTNNPTKPKPLKTKLQCLSLNFGITYNMMLIDDWTGVGFVLGYSLVDHVYDPYALGSLKRILTIPTIKAICKIFSLVFVSTLILPNPKMRETGD